MTPDATILDRAQGTLVGGAIGDALGAPVEFDHPSAIAGRREELEGLPGGGTFRWDPGEFTDDTQMAIVLGRTLAAGPLDEQELALRFAEWAQHPDTADVGNQTQRVLSRVRALGWQEASAGASPDAEGNGSLMRIGPVALAASSEDDAAALARRQSLVTHPNPLSLDACVVFARVLHRTLHEGAPPTVEQSAALASEDPVRTAILAAASPTPPEMSGFVLHTLTGALWAVDRTDTFGDALWRAVQLGRDADTVGAIAGYLAGARAGRGAIPNRLAHQLTTKHALFAGEYPVALEKLAEDLVAANRRTAR